MDVTDAEAAVKALEKGSVFKVRRRRQGGGGALRQVDISQSGINPPVTSSSDVFNRKQILDAQKSTALWRKGNVLFFVVVCEGNTFCLLIQGHVYIIHIQHGRSQDFFSESW